MNGSYRLHAAWDVPVRAFHWALVVLVATSIASGMIGGNTMVWHLRAGYAILSLLLFRLIWGIVGSRTARFADFVRGPARVVAYARELLRHRPPPALGHNPLGGWMVVLFLALLLFQAGSGLFANDDIATEGPLYASIGKDLSDRLTALHRLNAKLLLGLVGMHIGAVIYHWLRLRENLVGAMFSGRKRLPADFIAPPWQARSNWLALALFGFVATSVYLLVDFQP